MTFSKIAQSLADNLKIIVTIGSSIVAIIGAFIAAFGWLSNEITGKISERVDELSDQITQLKESSEEGDSHLRLGITRTELLMLMQHSPTNIAEIEKVGRYYFCDLGGDWYMSGVYSDWAGEYGGDIMIVTDCDT